MWTTPTPRQLLSGLRSAFVAPWGTPAVATVVLLLAAAGVVRLARASRMAVTTVAVAFGPYLAFHMLFQEAVTTRYALPLVMPIAYLAVCGVEFLTAPAFLKKVHEAWQLRCDIEFLAHAVGDVFWANPEVGRNEMLSR